MIEKTRVIGVPTTRAGWLVTMRGKRVGRDYRLSTTSYIGRDPQQCDVVIEDESVSARHACIKLERKRFVLYDLASTNRTLINGRQIESQVLEDGDQVQVGHTRLVFKEVGPA